MINGMMRWRALGSGGDPQDAVQVGLDGLQALSRIPTNLAHRPVAHRQDDLAVALELGLGPGRTHDHTVIRGRHPHQAIRGRQCAAVAVRDAVEQVHRCGDRGAGELGRGPARA